MSERHVPPLGGRRFQIRIELSTIISNPAIPPRDKAILVAVADFWWNEALDGPSKDRAEQELERLIPVAAAGPV